MIFMYCAGVYDEDVLVIDHGYISGIDEGDAVVQFKKCYGDDYSILTLIPQEDRSNVLTPFEIKDMYKLLKNYTEGLNGMEVLDHGN